MLSSRDNKGNDADWFFAERSGTVRDEDLSGHEQALFTFFSSHGY
jgi:hypothetical protein